MKTSEILSRAKFASGEDILSTLNFKTESKKARRRARLTLVMLGITAIAFFHNLFTLQNSWLWAFIAMVVLMLCRSLPATNQALRHARLTKAAAAKIQRQLETLERSGQAFAYSLSGFQPEMTLSVATITADNNLELTTLKAMPDSELVVESEKRQVYVRAWLANEFDRHWYRIAETRGLAISKRRVSLRTLSSGAS